MFLAGAGLSWLLLVAFMTERGYAGNQRYLIVTTAVICVLGGIGVGYAFEAAQRPGHPAHRQRPQGARRDRRGRCRSASRPGTR